jgi:hypothetical protein
MADTSVTAIATNLIVSPSAAFAAIRERRGAWFPLLLIVIGYCVLSFLYTSNVDIGWFFERQLASADMPAAERERAIESASQMSPATLGAVSAFSQTVFVLVWFSVVSLYYTGISFATKDGIKYKQWFAMLAWCALPLVLSFLASLVNMLVSDMRFMPQERINPLAFGALFDIDTTHATVGQRIVLGLDIMTVWSLVLTVLAYQAWTKRSIAVATAVVMGPIAIIVAIGALLSLR